MRIGIISPDYPYKGSSECLFVEALVNEFAKHGHQCTVIAPFSWITYIRKKRVYGIPYEKREIDKGIFVEIYKPRVITFRDYPIFGVSNSGFFERRAIENTIKRHKLEFDVIYCHFFAQGLRAFKYAMSHSLPLFVATGESTINLFNKPFKSFSLESFRNYLSGVVCVSSKNKDECIKLGYSDDSKCVVIPNSVDLTLFNNRCEGDTVKFDLNIKESDFVIVCVGEFSDRKGQNRIIEAVESIGDKSIKIILIGKYLSNNYKLLKSPHIIFQGSVEHNNLPAFLRASDVFVLPTLREGCCNAIIEAMACGLPVISSNLQFNWDILNAQNSILVNPQSIDDIANAIVILRKDSQKKISLAEHAHSDSFELSIEKRATKIENLLQKSLKK